MRKFFEDAAGVVGMKPIAGSMLRNSCRFNILATLLCILATACSSKQPTARIPQTSPASSVSAETSPVACPASQLAITLDAGDGRLNGMSHSGTMLVLRNIGSESCTIPARPTPTFTDSNNQPLAISADETSKAQSPSTLPITLAGDQTATSDMRWISGDVYGNGHCESPVHMTVAMGKQIISTSFRGHFCGAGGEPSLYTLTSFKLAQAPVIAATTPAMIYTCKDGRSVRAAYPDTQTAELTVAGKIYWLRSAVSADGARYSGEHWQWWTKGLHNAQLARLKQGESVSSSVGVSCAAP